jgi:hypothetical protein
MNTFVDLHYTRNAQCIIGFCPVTLEFRGMKIIRVAVILIAVPGAGVAPFNVNKWT